MPFIVTSSSSFFCSLTSTMLYYSSKEPKRERVAAFFSSVAAELEPLPVISLFAKDTLYHLKIAEKESRSMHFVIQL